MPQDPNDEPASALLERIRTERAKLIKEKRIKAPKGGESVIYRASDGSHYEKRGKGEPVCIGGEIPFEIPESWAWVRLESLLTDVIVPIRDKPTTLDGPIPWCRIEDVEGRYLSRSLTGQGVDEVTVQRMNLTVSPVGTVLCSNSATIGVPAIIKTPCVTNQRFIGFLPASGLDSSYLYLLFLAFNKALTTVGTGTTHVYISRSKFEQLVVPLPPVAEQNRIVSAFDEIEPIIDDYGILEDAREHLDAELPDRLRKSILQLAVQGKLVPQDPNDEPASVLLEQICAKRAKLIKEKKVKAPKGGESFIYRTSDGGYYEKRGKGEAVCIDDEIPFEIPENWAWARIRDFGFFSSGKTP
ncbi:MAG: restriction endonuclease subunit S, partial [Atopobiaceae bacterium]|nr:restriction endonuclease subunit S [Atopobiaceae bacterium]